MDVSAFSHVIAAVARGDSSMDVLNGIYIESGDQVYARLREDSLSSEQSDDTLGASDLDTAPLLLVMETKLYKRRWVMLLIFSAYSMSNSFMCLQYSAISNIFARFYRTETEVVNWFALSYLVTYVVFILPVMWLIDKRGLRETLLIGSAFNSIGACIKTGTAKPDMLIMAFVGQFVCAVADVFVLGIPAKLASVWFGEREVTTACSIGVLGNQVCLGVHRHDCFLLFFLLVHF